MLTILGGRHQLCDGLSRRSFLKIGSLGLGGLSLPQLLRAEQAQQRAHSHKAIIMVYLPGGPAHQDMYDLKPNAPDGIRGEFKPIKTNVPGVEICELLPRMAAIMDKLAIVRTVVGAGPAHDAHQCLSGHTRRPEPMGGWPSLGSVASRLQGPTNPAVPPFVGLSAIRGNGPQADAGSPGYLGLGHGPFQPAGGRNSITLHGVTLERLHDRRNLLASFNSLRRGLEQSSEVAGMEECTKRAFEMLTSTRVAEALDLRREDPRMRERYTAADPKRPGAAPKQLEQFLVARRLVQAGVRCVTLSFGRWDNHSRNFVNLRRDMPLLDQGVAALVQDLHDRGLGNDVSVVVWGEFGRSPQVNGAAGREHWPRVSCAMLAGGGMRTGQVIGVTDRQAGAVDDRPVHFQEVFATLYQRLGIDPAATVLHDISGRPQRLVDIEYLPIAELV